MKSFKLSLISLNFPKINRKIQSAQVKLLSTRLIDTLKFLNLRSLNFFSSCILEKHELCLALTGLEHLENFTADAVFFTPLSEIAMTTPANLPNLKSIDFKCCSNYIMQTFATSSLKSVVFKNREQERDPRMLIDLLKHQKDLLTFRLFGVICNYFFLPEYRTDFQFNLKSFEVTPLRNPENVWEFLKKHRSSLEELTIPSSVPLNMKLGILTELPALTTLEIAFGTENLSQLNALPPLTKVTRLKLLGCMTHARNTTDILKLFPSLTAIDLSELTIQTNQDFCNIYDFIHRTYNSLREIHFNSLQFYDEDSEKFRNLKEFHVTSIKDESHYNLFLRDHAATLEKISIGFIKDDDFARGLTVNAINHCRKLKHVSFVSSTPMVTKMFSKIQRDYPWTLQSRFKNCGLCFKLTFNFPDDKAVFDERCRTWDDKLIRDFCSVSNYGLNAFINKFK
jgi:hypothetical protein